ncbi:MAG TPA: TilS substrate-binding domain-containing protein, partial [Pseudonocardiaceae bacterium]|nr:TilS substrate-binding domain-containing protein [Pseudonocardiaceae bacterium]
LGPDSGPGSDVDSDDVDSDVADLDVATLAQAPAALRRRALRRWLLDAGVTELTDAHLRAADDLVGRWSGQGALRLPGALELLRAQGRLHVSG